MTRYFFDLYPRDDPVNGTLIQRLEAAPGGLQRAEYRGEANGAGVGLLAVRGDGDYGQLIDPEGLQYVRVVEDNEAVRGGFFLENGDFDAITEQNTRLLTFTGAGALSYLDREIMWSYTYHPVVGADDPFDRLWRLYAQGFGLGDYLGNSFYRALFEAKGYNGAPGYRTVTPRNGEKVDTAIPDLTIGFDGFVDSDGNPWTLPSGDMTVSVGDTLYQVAKRHMEAGLYIEVDPDTFECRAWEADGHRRDRSGGSFGANVVRFVQGVNIKSDATRGLAAFIKRTSILAVGPDDTAERADGTGDVIWHSANLPDITDPGALSWLAVTELSRRADAGDIVRLKMVLGDSPTTGEYRPFAEIQPDDIVTVDSGSGQWDWDEATFPVAALEVKLREAGDWDAWAELGASFSSIANRAFQAAGVPHHTHPPNPALCRPDFGVSPPLLDTESAAPGGGTGSLTVPGGLSNSALFFAVGLGPFGTGLPSFVRWTIGASNYPATLIDSHVAAGVGIAIYRLWNPPAGTGTCNADGLVHGVWLLEDVDQVTPAYAFDDGVGAVSGAALTVPIASTLLRAVMFYDVDFVNEGGGFSATPGAGVTEDFERTHQYGSPGYSDLVFAGGHGGSSSQWTGDQSRPWVAVVMAPQGVGVVVGDTPKPTVHTGEGAVGTSVRASRCDHEHAHGLLSDDEAHYHDVSQIEGYEAPESVSVPVTASDLTTYMEPAVDYDGHVTIDGAGNPVMVEVSF